MGHRSRTAEDKADVDVFIIRGRVAGEDTLITSTSPAGAATVLNIWLSQDPQAQLAWVVNENWPESIVLAARLHANLPIGQEQKAAHLFVFQPGDQVGPTLASRCGRTFDWWSLEFADALDTPMGAPCMVCELSLTGAPQQPTRPSLPSLQTRGRWHGWDTYYTELGWPIREHDRQLLLTAEDHPDVVVLSVPVDHAKQVQEDLAETNMQAPLLYLPTMPEDALFVVTRTIVPVPIPEGVHRVPAGVPLPPSPVFGGTVTLEWTTSPDEVIHGRCRDLDVIAAIYKIYAKEREQPPRRELT